MKILGKNNIFRKIILSFIIVITLFFAVPIRSEAGLAKWAGNTLGQPIMQFVAMSGDVFVGLLHKYVLNNDYPIMDSILLDEDNKTVTEGDLAVTSQDEKNNAIDHTNITFDGNVLGITSSESESIADKAWDATKDAAEIGYGTVLGGVPGTIAAYNDIKERHLNAYIPNIMVCPEYIFSNRIAMLDVDFVNPTEYENQDTEKSVTKGLQSVVASWYRAFRNIAIVAMLTILVYIGIRILLGSTAQDKAKYKERIQDWLVGLCLIFIMHYIMAGTLMLTKGITNLLSEVTPNYVVRLSENFPRAASNTGKIEEDENKVFYVKENLTGYVRLMAQQQELTDCFAYVVMYIVLVIFTYMFLIKYIKRVLYMAFFTIISPLVAMTYPLDKLADGKSQGFSMWFKEYLMNALIQPVHLILYTVFVSSAASLAKNNLIYAIVALGFLIPAEKFIKSMFRLDRGQTTGTLGDIAGGALAFKGIQSLSRAGKNYGKASGGGSSKNNSKDDKIRINKNGTDYLNDIWGNSGNANAANPLPAGGNGNPPQPNLPQPNPPQPNPPQPNPPQPNSPQPNSPQPNSPQPNPQTPVGGNGNPPIPAGRNGNPQIRRTPALSANAQRLNRQNRTYTRRTNGVPAGAMAGRALRAVGNGIYNNRRRIIKGAVGAVARGAVGVVGATVGLAGGITTGDVSKAIAYTTGGYLAGRALGNKATNAGEALLDAGVSAAGTIRDVYQEEAYGLEQAEQMRKDRENERARNEFMRNSDEIKKYKEVAGKLGIDDYRTVMDYAWDYKEAGLTDDDKIAKGLELENKYANDPNMSHEKMIGVMQVAQNMTAKDITDEKNRAGLEKSLTAKLKNKDLAQQFIGYAADAVGEKATWDDYINSQKQPQPNPPQPNPPQPNPPQPNP